MKHRLDVLLPAIVAFFTTLFVLHHVRVSNRNGVSGRNVTITTTEIRSCTQSTTRSHPVPAKIQSQPQQQQQRRSQSHQPPHRITQPFTFVLPISHRARTFPGGNQLVRCLPQLDKTNNTSGSSSNNGNTFFWVPETECGIVIVVTIATGESTMELVTLVQSLRASEWSEPFSIRVVVDTGTLSRGFATQVKRALKLHPRVSVVELSGSDAIRFPSQLLVLPRANDFMFPFSLVVDSRLSLGGQKAVSPVFLLERLVHFDAVVVQMMSIAEDESDELQLPNPFVFAIRAAAFLETARTKPVASNNEVLSSNKRQRTIAAARELRSLLSEQAPHFATMPEYYAAVSSPCFADPLGVNFVQV